MKRQRMRSGFYRPGSRLPTHRELLKEFHTSPVTLQRAFDLLREVIQSDEDWSQRWNPLT